MMTTLETATERFVEDLRAVLQHLYDPNVLGRTPMLAWLGLDQRHNPALGLRQLLISAVGALKPGKDVPIHSTAWRVYHILNWRYVEQTSQRDVASNMAVSPRQLRRLEWSATQALADYLWARYDLHAVIPTSEEKEGDADTEPSPEEPNRQQELRWLRDSFPSEVGDIADLLAAACKTVAPLVANLRVRLDCETPTDLPPVTGQLAALRQALINLLTVAVHAVPEGRVTVSAKLDGQGICLSVRARREHSSGDANWRQEGIEHLKITRQFAQLLDGSLDVLSDEDHGYPFIARLRLPGAEQWSVLAIDDNADVLQLIERYCSGTRYRVLSTRDPGQALALAEEYAPDVVVLDIMLPNVDGWELLGRLREHPALGNVPIIVCTILPQEKLAMTLGAAGFLRKPISRKDFLAALEAQVPA
jgi:CheY-like chemotaxis protein